jgi:hypothetical protein
MLIAKIFEKFSDIEDGVFYILSDEILEYYFEAAGLFILRIRYEIDTGSYKANTDNLNETEKEIKTNSAAVWVSVEKFLSLIALYKVKSTNTVYEYISSVAKFKSKYKLANTVAGSTYALDSDKQIEVSFPANLFDGTSVGTTDEIKIITISWNLNPEMIVSSDNYTSMADMIS